MSDAANDPDVVDVIDVRFGDVVRYFLKLEQRWLGAVIKIGREREVTLRVLLAHPLHARLHRLHVL